MLLHPFFKLLSRNLPNHPEAFSPAIYKAVVSFVLETGRVDAGARAGLEAVLKDENPGLSGNPDRKKSNG